MDTRADSRSPSMIPRKASGTPSSSRTTPEISNRKSYSSGLSIGSTTSFNTVRTSTGSLQPRLPQSMSTSRLPAPKHTTVHSSHAAEDDEDVPPVPAIPKAYESPKDSPADTYFMEKKKTGLSTVDTIASFGNSTGSITMPVLPEPTKVQHRASARKSSIMPSTGLEDTTGVQMKKQLQPLRLPPLNIGPLNLPTNPKSLTSSDYTSSGRALSPPPSRQLPKTPTTPMTASKSSFFSKSKYDETIEMPSLRSSSSVHHAHRSTPTPPDGDSSDSSISISESKQKASISPFLSSSLPKGGFEHGFLKRSKTGGDYATLTGNAFDDRAHPKPAGPREPNMDKPVPKSPPPAPAREEPQTPTSKSSLRRKLSLTWKRGNSKGSLTGAMEMDKPGTHQQSKQETMPPPRIPTSATTSSLSTAKHPDPSPVVGANGKYLESRRRKSSAASLTNYAPHDRVRSDTWASKKEGTEAAAPASRNQGPANRTIRPRTSMTTMRSALYSAADLDKDDMVAEEEMRKMGSRRKETEVAARALDALRKRATPKERVGAHEAVRIAMLNIYERGEIIDFDDIYFCGTQNAHKVVGNVQSDAPNFGYDDERGDYTIVPGDHLAYRYEIIDVLGKGSFGQVVRCIDHKLGVLVAVKIIRNKKRFHQQALVEVNILQKLREWVRPEKQAQHGQLYSALLLPRSSLHLDGAARHEPLRVHQGPLVPRVLLTNHSALQQADFELADSAQTAQGDSLRFETREHLAAAPLHSEIKVIDFGSSCFEHEKVYTYIQSRFYRSPEVILGMTYGMPIDMWSVGCILAELYTGVPIFPGENEQEQLACIMEVFGPPEKHLIEKSTRKKLFFDSMGKPRLTVSSKGRRRRPSSKTLQQALKCDDEAFIDFLARCLRWDPDRRLKPEEAIRHEFITGQKPTAPIPRLPARDPSPVKRSNTVSAPRPLPDPPGAMGRGLNAVRTGVSPHKPVSGPTSRRVSGATAATAASINRRTSAGGGSISGSISGLPRAAIRTASGKQDLAAAGASAAMSRKA
ncbi:hypothetical protein ACCO45_006063 [Purpureocillium lilacinum]|uniref:Uncharacterized protein n=1 Tax=Purpureocillium lilacinum TaxID=33203 RepID=A0ACC4DX57_PURLI